MIFITRCTNCHSIFRVTVTQLRIQDGKLRCGQCRHIFNALPTLRIAADAQIASITPLAVVEKDQQATAVATGEVTDHAGEKPDFLDFPATSQRSSPVLKIAIYVLSILLIWQLVHGFRSEIAIAIPAWRKPLEKYCAVVQCNIALPRQLSLLSLESSELKLSTTETTDEMSLTAIIRNHAPFTQEWPVLLLSLTDVNDRVVASQILQPQDYLAPEARDAIETGFSAHHEIVVQRSFRLEGAQAIGYRLELRY